MKQPRRLSLALGLCAFTALAPAPALAAQALPSAAGQHVSQGEALFRTGHYGEARAEFEAAAAGAPAWVVPRYYIAYVDYKKGDFAAARRGFEVALAVDPADGWSRYMLALSMAKLGDTRAARAALDQILASQPDPEISRTARSTLAEIDERERQAEPAAPVPSPWALALEVGLAGDTNPAYLADRSYEASDATALEGVLRAAAEYRAPLGADYRLFVGAQGHEQAILVHRQDADWTAFGAWLGLARPGDPVSGTVEYSYEYSLFGNDPFQGTHRIWGAIEWKEADWTATRIEPALAFRSSLADEFDYLESSEIAVSIGQVLSLAGGSLVVTPAWTFVRDWADHFSLSFETDEGDESLYTTNYSFFGHGPGLALRARLPWGSRLTGGLAFLWKEFDEADSFTTTTEGRTTTVSEDRSDERLTIEATLSRTFARRWTIFVALASIDNFSSLGDEGGDFVDRNYSRRKVVAGLRYEIF